MPKMIQKLKFGKEFPQIFCLERGTIARMARHE